MKATFIKCGNKRVQVAHIVRYRGCGKSDVYSEADGTPSKKYTRTKVEPVHGFPITLDCPPEELDKIINGGVADATVIEIEQTAPVKTADDEDEDE